MSNTTASRATPRRQYDSSRRKAQARGTRLQIAEAARQLFLARGYAGATIEAIAERAAVATETVYAIFQNKRNVLAFLLDISVAGDDEPVPIIKRSQPQAILRDTDSRRLLKGFAEDITEILARAAAIFEVTQIAGKTEPEIETRVKHLLAERLENMRLVAGRIAANGPLRAGMDEEQAAQLLWTVTSPAVYLLNTGYLGWTRQEHGKWLAETLERLLLP
jgi:AcrR family transcriptional regulator